jgi:hypothetical protein
MESIRFAFIALKLVSKSQTNQRIVSSRLRPLQSGVLRCDWFVRRTPKADWIVSTTPKHRL